MSGGAVEMKQRKHAQRQFAFACAYSARLYTQNVYMLTITQTNHIVVTHSAFVMKVFTGGSSSEVQSRPWHYVICAQSPVDVEHFEFPLNLFLCMEFFVID